MIALNRPVFVIRRFDASSYYGQFFVIEVESPRLDACLADLEHGFPDEMPSTNSLQGFDGTCQGKDG